MKKIIAGNWKMYMTIPESERLALEISAGVSALLAKVEVVICPPFTALATVRAALAPVSVAPASGSVSSSPVSVAPAGDSIRVGAQNMHFEASGAFTGECSGPMLRSAGCDDVIIGHSERRHIFNEADELIALKVPSAIEVGLRPILCVGETGAERDLGLTFNVVERQMRIGLSRVQGADDFVIAYEPVWAIGTGRTATPEQAQEVHEFIRRLLGELYPDRCRIPILYGGSVKPDNAAELLAQPDIDGALVGGASLKAESFNRLVEIASRTTA